MKVLHFISAPAAGGAEIYVKDMVKNASRLGYKAAIVFLGDSNSINRCSKFEAAYLSELKECGVSTYFLPNSSRFNPLLAYYAMYKINKDFQPDIVHCHLMYGVIYSIFSSGKIVYTHHNIRMDKQRALFYFFDFFISQYIGICEICKVLLQKQTNKPVEKISNAVDVRKLSLIRKNHKNKRVKVIMVGGLNHHKNYSLALNAINLVRSDNFILEVAGEGRLRNELLLLTKRLGLQDKVKFLGNINNVYEKYAESDIFMMTSCSEGLPIALLEASLSGLPVIVSNVGGCKEIVDEISNGFVIDKLCPIEFAKKIELLIDNENLRFELAENAKDNSGRYEIKHAIEEHYRLYHKVVLMD